MNEHQEPALIPRKPAAQSAEGTEIDLMALLGFYISRLPLLILALVIGGLAAGAYTHFRIPSLYTATARMYMVSSSSDTVVNLSDLILGTSLSNDYVELMKTRPVLEDVIDKLELKYRYNQLLGMISLNVVSNTRIVRVSATSTDPEEAMNIANELARSAKVQLPKVMDAPSPTIAEYAVLPTTRSSPSLSRNVLTGGLLAMAAVLAVLTVLFLMDDTIKGPEDLEREFGFMPLTVIPEGVIEGFQPDTEQKKRGRSLPFRKNGKGADA